jgi:hypothetical protein
MATSETSAASELLRTSDTASLEHVTPGVDSA